ncbi:hypothetical protein O4J56_04040 [Nocardiopsis sp. RSe5-2]|uniref:DUF2207 domain-containing protein n=1 Tax=Nocardiopsis endophytica TaxID=3018445 RepID=A0ABT4TYM0_9ACTN|nr:hypothetical protein [Nocardiopsis endophytica]MDA2809801.1 hypothetical protein [Nocardiopsis endophytica]
MRSPTTDPQHIAEGWRLRAHPRSAHRVMPGGADPVVGSGSTWIRLRLFAEEHTTFALQRRPYFPFAGTPVVLIDGIPALQGFGEAAVEVSRKRHLVEVQGGGSRGWWMVDGAAAPFDGPAAELDFYNDVCNPRHRWFERDVLGAAWFFGPPGSRAIPKHNYDSTKGNAPNGVGIFIAWVALTALGAVVFRPDGGAVAALIAAVALLPAVLLAIGAERVLDWSERRPVDRHERLQRSVPLESGDTPVTLLGRQAAPVPRSGPGAAGLVVDLRFEQVWQRVRVTGSKPVSRIEKRTYMFPGLEYLEPGVDDAAWHNLIRYGEPLGAVERPWMEAPAVYVDGRRVEARWARIHLRLEPGGHRLRVEVPRFSRGPRRPDGAGGTVVAESDLTMVAGETALADVLAETVLDGDGASFEYEVVELSSTVRNRVARLETYRRPRPPLRHEGSDFQSPAFSFSLEVTG